MTDFHAEMRKLSKQLAELEPRLGEVAGEVAELQSVLAPFMVRFRREVLQYHDQLLAVEREIADLRIMRGEGHAGSSSFSESPLRRFSEDNPSVQEQYERVWQGKEVPRFSGPDLPPASDRLKKHYAQVIAHEHPGLAGSQDDRARRARVMATADEAYIKRDEIGLHGMAEMYRNHSNLPSVVDADTVRQLRDRVFNMETLIAQLEGQLFELRYGDIAKVKAHADAARKNGHNLLQEMATEVQNNLDRARSELASLK